MECNGKTTTIQTGKYNCLCVSNCGGVCSMLKEYRMTIKRGAKHSGHKLHDEHTIACKCDVLCTRCLAGVIK